MKQHVHKFFNTPKLVALFALLVAVPVGVIGYVQIHKIPVLTLGDNANSQIVSSNSSSDLTLGFVSGGRIASVSVKTGDVVKKGQLLAALDAGNAVGALSQARAAFATAQANYQKVINGATGPSIDVAKASLNTAKINLAEATKQQNVLVANAHRTLLNSTLVAQLSTDTTQTPPTISGLYTKEDEGVITVNTFPTADGGYFNLGGLGSGTGSIKKASPQPLGDSGLFIQFPADTSVNNTTWTITIPNTTAPNYLVNYNAYQQAIQTKSQVLASAQAAVDQAQANLTQLVSAARPEDIAVASSQVENARGALQIAEAAYLNTVITAPGDGTITSVSISAGQIAVPNAPAIEILITR